MALDPSIVDSVANNNFKTIAEGAAFYSNLAMKAAVEEQGYRSAAAQRREQAADAAHSKQLQNYVETGAQEAVADTKILSGVDSSSQGHILASTMSQISAALGQIQQMVKLAVTTPPESPIVK